VTIAILPNCRGLFAQLAPNEQSARAMRLERFVVPEFPPFLRQAGVMQGTVVVAIGRGERDRPGDILVLESSDARFADAALEAIREWRFQKAAESPAAPDNAVSVVRFLFTTGSVAVVPLSASGRPGTRRSIRADSPIELPNFSHCDTSPALVEHPAPEFPPTLRDRVTQGTAVIKYFVDTSGRVRLPAVVSASAPEFGLAAVAAMRRWRYEAPRIDGKPVIVLERHSFQFGAPTPR
jgi:TonB family protein